MCEVVKIGNSVLFICRGGHKPNDHVCDEKAAVYELRSGERVFIKDENDNGYYEKNYQNIISASVVCSICKHAAIDDAPYL